MTLEEFTHLEPELARELRRVCGDRMIPMHIGWVTDGPTIYVGTPERWVAICEHAPTGEWEFVYEARCRASCIPTYGESVRPRAAQWVFAHHVCCDECEVDTSHYYASVHE